MPSTKGIRDTAVGIINRAQVIIQRCNVFSLIFFAKKPIDNAPNMVAKLTNPIPIPYKVSLLCMVTRRTMGTPTRK